MKCEYCDNTATEKHHISYFPEVTIGVCYHHARDIHDRPYLYPGAIKYKYGEAKQFYSQKERIERFIRNLFRK